MIDKDRIDGKRKYTCDNPDCGTVAHFSNIDEAQKKYGWGISYERIYCYCPKCAPKYRHVGRAGIKTGQGQQLSIDEELKN